MAHLRGIKTGALEELWKSAGPSLGKGLEYSLETSRVSRLWIIEQGSLYRLPPGEGCRGYAYLQMEVLRTRRSPAECTAPPHVLSVTALSERFLARPVHQGFPARTDSPRSSREGRSGGGEKVSECLEGPRRRGEGNLLLQEILSRASCAPSTTGVSLDSCDRNRGEDRGVFWWAGG